MKKSKGEIQAEELAKKIQDLLMDTELDLTALVITPAKVRVSFMENGLAKSLALKECIPCKKKKEKLIEVKPPLDKDLKWVNAPELGGKVEITEDLPRVDAGDFKVKSKKKIKKPDLKDE